MIYVVLRLNGDGDSWWIIRDVFIDKKRLNVTFVTFPVYRDLQFISIRIASMLHEAMTVTNVLMLLETETNLCHTRGKLTKRKGNFVAIFAQTFKKEEQV